jgi:alpha-2-macroglobulin
VGYFYAREALGMKSWDIYDYILGAFGGKLERIFAIGGDESLYGQSKQKRGLCRW